MTIRPRVRAGIYLGVLALLLVAGLEALTRPRATPGATADPPSEGPRRPPYRPRLALDTSGFNFVASQVPLWPADASLDRVAAAWRPIGPQLLNQIDQEIRSLSGAWETSPAVIVQGHLSKCTVLNYQGEAGRAYTALGELRTLVETTPELAADFLFTVVYYQGLTALRLGENENCVLCRGESSCIVPISPAAVHTKPAGSRSAIAHFTEYLEQFPDDLEVRWLLCLAHMTLGEYPDRVAPRFLVPLDRYTRPEFGIGRFRDVAHRVGVYRFNQAGGTIMDDFDNDGRLDLVFTTFDPTQGMAFFRNTGDGTFEDRTGPAGLTGQVGGGLYCVQTDYNNDGFLDVFITRGAWLKTPVRPSLLRNNGDGTFTDVTAAAGLAAPANSITAAWADYDNDGRLDLFVGCETQPSRLYHNRGDGTFEEVGGRAGVDCRGMAVKGIAWADYDNDGYPDLFVNDLRGAAKLFRNNKNGRFSDVTAAMGIDGPETGFSCWAWDYDNDGHLDIFATSYDRSVADVVKGLIGEPHARSPNKLYRNLGGKGFQDVTKAAGLDMVFATMGSNFGDFDNDGFPDMYLGTGDPNLSMLVPKRMFRNLGGTRFAEITGSSGTGHLQKGHAVACGDWDRDGNTDIAVSLGGAIPGDRYHNALFQNPGQGNNWLNVKLVGKKTNRAAIGARIKVVAGGDRPLTVHRHVSSGSSFGANPLEQAIGLGRAGPIVTLEVHWPTSGTTQTFRDVPVNRFVEVTEFEPGYRTRDLKPIRLPD